MVYYEFNRTGKGGKYKKMSAEEYEQAKQDPKRWFLEGWDEDGKALLYVMECSTELSMFYDGASSSVADVVMEKLSRSHTREQICVSIRLAVYIINCGQGYSDSMTLSFATRICWYLI